MTTTTKGRGWAKVDSKAIRDEKAAIAELEKHLQEMDAHLESTHQALKENTHAMEKIEYDALVENEPKTAEQYRSIKGEVDLQQRKIAAIGRKMQRAARELRDRRDDLWHHYQVAARRRIDVLEREKAEHTQQARAVLHEYFKNILLARHAHLRQMVVAGRYGLKEHGTHWQATRHALLAPLAAGMTMFKLNVDIMGISHRAEDRRALGEELLNLHAALAEYDVGSARQAAEQEQKDADNNIPPSALKMLMAEAVETGS